ncbi:MAG: MATE family efflux transporter [Wenzhouxiangellaceae bacterium]|nr:MATE family efflux transporter [Wenzhouxiangellaceae bacterium]
MIAHEVRRTLILAGPLIIGQLTSFGMNFVDTIMAGRLGQIDLGAIAVGSSIWAAGLLFVLGVLMSLSPAVSQLDGAGRPRQAGELVRQGLWIALFLTVVMLVLARNAGWVMRLLSVEPAVAELALGYLVAMSWGAPALLVLLVFRFFAEGTGRTRPTMYVGVLGIVLNVPLNYVLMFGKFGFEPMGAVGCGWATAIVFWLQALALVAYVRWRRHFAPFAVFERGSPPNAREIIGLLRVGLPIGVMIFFEGGLFVATALLIGTLGALPIAAHQVAINFAAMAFMVPLGLAGAITVRVGNAIGRGDPFAARLAGRVGIGMAAVFGLVSATIMSLFPTLIARIYTNDAEVIALAAHLLMFAAVFQVSDGLQASAAGALRGLKDTRRPMVYSLLSYWCVGLALGAWLTFARDFGAVGMWLGLIAGLSVAAVLMTGRFWRITRAFSDANTLRALRT